MNVRDKDENFPIFLTLQLFDKALNANESEDTSSQINTKIEQYV